MHGFSEMPEQSCVKSTVGRGSPRDYSHLSVKSSRGHLLIFAGDDQPVARLTPLDGGPYGLSFMRHTGRWKPMLFNGDITEMPSTVVVTLGPYLQRYELPSGISGSHH
jgi:hypothetical protein